MDANYPMTLLYDGACPICCFEVAWLARRDRHSRLRFVDFADPQFDADRWGRERGLARFPGVGELGARIHAVTAAQELVRGVEVFRLAYQAVGLGWLIAPTRLPFLRGPAERAYLAFARNRYALSRRYGRLFARLTPSTPDACEAGACRIYRQGERNDK